MFGRGANGLLRGLVGRLKGGCGGLVYDSELVADLFELALSTSKGGVAGSMEGIELGCDVVAVGGEVVGDRDKLRE
jgi:hypothetical protein